MQIHAKICKIAASLYGNSKLEVGSTAISSWQGLHCPSVSSSKSFSSRIGVAGIGGVLGSLGEASGVGELRADGESLSIPGFEHEEARKDFRCRCVI